MKAVTAAVEWQHPTNDTRNIRLSTGHLIEMGGDMSATYCYEHQSFDCFDALTEDEVRALETAE